MARIPGYDINSVLHRSTTRSIYAALRLRDGLPVIIKTLNAEYPSRQSVAELRREFQIIHKLQPVENVIRAHALESYGNGNVGLVLERFGSSLAELIAETSPRAFSLERFFKLAISLAETIARVHELDVVHKNLEPRSILIDDSDLIRLVDFRISSELSVERQHYAMSKRFEGKLPYMSPEQTGRMNRDLDYRSDYYSLGVTLFELSTGILPFHADSVLGWVHSHISKVPRSPSEINPAIPKLISEILLKLLAKNAEDRYQSSYGLIADLNRCRRELAASGNITTFILGEHDVSRKFQIPQKLYGRESELAVLTAVFEQVASGSTELCMVSGHSGIGKSALVNEIGKLLVSRRGYLIQGKFDQFYRSTPYSTVGAAFRSLIQQLLTESHERRERLREKLLAALSPNAQLLIELMPNLELIIGPQPPVSELPRVEAQNRFHIAILNFLRAISNEHPLVLFLDDLHFGDSSTLNLIRWLATARDLSGLLLIGAYRSNEVEAGHSLHLVLSEMKESRPVHELELRPLELASVEQLVADALRTDVADCQSLSKLLHDRAQGNPFFLIEMLRSLEQARAITYATESGRWRWDINAIRSSRIAGNVVDLIIGNLRALPSGTQRALKLAACIGNTFDLRILSIINETSMDETGETLLPALQRQIVIPLHEDYKLVGKAAGAGPSTGPANGGGLNPIYRFQHDRVQQAAYALIDDEHKQAVHLSVGRLIQRHATEQDRDQRLIDIVNHLNEGRRLISDPFERKELARLNLMAGIRTQRASAYESALAYLRIGIEMLPTASWMTDYDLTMKLATEYQQCAYLTARYTEAEWWIEQMLGCAGTDLEKAEILSMRTRQYATTGKMEASIKAAIKGLSLLGISITQRPSREEILREKAKVKRNLAGRRIADLVSAPTLTDRAKIVSIRLLMEIFPAAFLSGSGDLFPFLVLKSVNISLQSGNSPETAFAYAAYGMLLCGELQDPALGCEFGKLAVAMNDRFDDIALKSRVIYVYAMFIHHWSKHWSSMTPWFRRGIEAGYQSGDLLYLAYSAQDCIIWDPKLDLETATRDHANYMNIVRECKYQDSLDSGTLFLQMQRNFLGLTDGLCSMNDVAFDEHRCVDGMRKRKFMTGVANYHIYKAEICFFYGNYAEALTHVRAQDQLIASAMSLPQLVRFYIVAFLTLAACLPGMDLTEQGQTRKRMHADLRRMSRWAAHCPENFMHLALLMRAELARLDGRVEAALHLYEQAIEAAHAVEFVRDEAMANELAARHLLTAGRRKPALGYLLAAQHLYERWGARRKVEQVRSEFEQLVPQLLGGRGSAEADQVHLTIDSAALDLGSVMKASRAISGEVLLHEVWATTMRVMLENAGGRRGCFVIRKDGKLVIEGLCDVGSDPAEPKGSVSLDSVEGALLLPTSVVHQVLRNNSPVVVHEAAKDQSFAKDVYLRARQPQSMLCIPLVRHEKFEGAIYMENSLAAGVFTEERIEVIKLLAAQTSISVENANLYASQQSLIDAQNHFVPSQFLESLHYRDIARIAPGEHVVKKMSMMFADLRNFTPLAERLDARLVMDLLNRFFVSMEPQISSRGGFIDSFDGDRIKALFDGPADAPVRAGIGMWRALEELNSRSTAPGRGELQMGIGVNTGHMILGVVGGHHRMQCSVVGDAANLASRIEQLTKLYRAPLLIGEHTFRSLPDTSAFAIRMVDRVAVKGKSSVIELYEVIDAETPERRAAKLETQAALCTAMELCFGGEFKAALTAFKKISRQDPLDVVPVLFAERCARYVKEPPPEGWKGFEQLNEKNRAGTVSDSAADAAPPAPWNVWLS
jgi:predicted ATPase/class 3 adenylate cyclase/GAF domain-containing protein